MKETQHCNENSFPWHMVDSKWNAVARDEGYLAWYLYKEKPDCFDDEGYWYTSSCIEFDDDTQNVIGVDMSQWNDVPWDESLMLRPGYRENTEDGNCDDVLSKEEADHLVNSVKEYPVVKMKELHNYKIGDVVRLKKTGELVVISKFTGYSICTSCALCYIEGCDVKSNCNVIGSGVYFKPVKE